MRKATVNKNFGVTDEERAMLVETTARLGYKSMADALRDMMKNWPKTGELGDELEPLEKANRTTLSTNLTIPEMNRLNKLSAQYGVPSGRIIRHLIRARYESLPSADETPTAEVQAETPAEAEPTATQMPLPEPLSEAEAIAMRIEAERMHNPVEFRAALLKVLGRIADALDALNENRGADAAELGRITNQLKTLNNAVWNR